MQNNYFLDITAAILALGCLTAQAGEFEDGLTAYQKQDYQQAVKLWQPLAEQGDVRARYNLALVYLKQPGKQAKKATEYLIMSRSAGLIDSYFLNSVADSEVSKNSAQNTPSAWLFKQNKQYYTLQLATGKTPEPLIKMKQRLIAAKQLEQLGKLSILKVKVIDKQNKNIRLTRYVLVYGVFDSYPKAKNEVVKLPEKLQKARPWIRQFGVLQSILSKNVGK